MLFPRQRATPDSVPVRLRRASGLTGQQAWRIRDMAGNAFFALRLMLF
jgi:hypothetical protein